MDGATYERVNAIFRELLQVTPEEREQRIEELCEGNASLWESVRLFLQHAKDVSLEMFLEDTADLKSTPAEVGTIDASDPGSLFGTYEILEEISRGGMGVVYKARQANVNRIVALKMIRSGELAGEEEIRRFETEAAAAAQLDHPGIVPVYEAGRHDGQPFLSMAFVEGTSLMQRVREAPLPPREAAMLLKRVAEAMQYAHDHAVVHRDLKPHNILVDQHGEPRVTDFGLAKNLVDDDQLTKTGQIVGTPAYMSPEQARGESDVGPLWDVYSLGSTLYCLLTGRPPFQAATPMETIRQVIEREPLSPRQINPEVERDLETICLKCLEKEPSKRYRSPRELADELQRYLDHLPILARRLSAAARGWRWARRNPARALASAAAAIAFMAVVALAVGYDYQQELERANDNLQFSNDQLNVTKSRLQSANTKLDGLLKTEKRLGVELATKKDEVDQLLYVRRVSSAYAAWQDNQIARARELLDACPEPLRNWEWGFVKRLCFGAFRTRFQTQRGHIRIAFNRKRNLMATMTADARFNIWDGVSGDLICQTAPGPTASATTFEFTPDGTKLVSAHMSGGVVAPVSTNGDEKALRRSIASIRIWDVDANRVVREIKFSKVSFISVIAFSPDGERMATGSVDGRVRLFDTTTGTLLLTIVEPPIQGFYPIIGGVSFSNDGKRIFSSANSRPGEIRVWDAATGNRLTTWRGSAEIKSCLAAGPNGQRLIAGGHDGTVTWWDVTTGEQLARFRGHSLNVNSADFSPDGTLAVTASSDTTICLWQSKTGTLLKTLRGSTAEVARAMFLPDNRHIVSSSYDRVVAVWDSQLEYLNRKLETSKSRVHAVAISPDGRLVARAGGDGLVKVWSRDTGKLLHSLKGHSRSVNSVAFNHDGTRLVSGGIDKNLIVWDVHSGENLSSIEGHSEGILAVSCSPVANLAASAGSDNSIRVWDISQARQVAMFEEDFEGPLDSVSDVAFAPSGRLLVSADVHGEIACWDLDQQKRILSFRASSQTVNCVAFAPDGRSIAADGPSGVIRIWDPDNGKEIAALPGHLGTLQSLAFSPDGHRLVSGGSDNMIRIWDVKHGLEILSLADHTKSVNSVAFSGDGYAIVSGSSDGTVRIWSTKPRDDSADQPGESWETHWKAAEGFHRAQQYQSAVAEYERVLQQNPQHLAAWERCGEAYALCGDHLRAAAHFSQAIERGANGAGIRLERGLAYQRLRRFQEAAADFREVLDEQPAQIEALAGRAEAFAKMRKWESALSDLESLRVYEPDDVGVRRQRIDALQHLQRWNDVIAECSNLLQIVSDDADLWFQRGSAFAQLKNWSDAIGDIDRAIALEPNRREFRLRRAYALRQIGRRREADEEYSRYLVQEPDTPRGFNNRGSYFFRLRQHEKALDDFTRAIELNPSFVAAIRNRGRAHFAMGRFEESAADYSRSISINPDVASQWYWRGKARAALGKSEQAIADYSQAIQLDGDGALYWRERGVAHVRQKNWQDAISDYTRAIELAPDSTAWRYRGLAHSGQKQWKKAEDDFKKAAELNPKDWMALRFQGYAHVHLKQWKDAADAYRQAIAAGPNENEQPYTDLFRFRAIALLRASDLDGYEAVCSEFQDRFGDTDNPQLAGSIAWTCCLAPLTSVKMDAVVALATKAAAKPSRFRLNTLGASLYRVGKFTRAIEKLSQADTQQAAGGNVTGWIFQAMAHHQLGDDSAAETWFGKVQSERAGWDQELPASWVQEQELRLLLKEATALITPKED